jgi:GT2 family glycosyltransferase
MINPATKSVTAVTVTYESAKIIENLALTLRRFVHVIAVDNASDDGTVHAISLHLPNAKIIKNNKNLGFGAGNNLGVASVQTQFALLLNPDCEISHDALTQLLLQLSSLKGCTQVGSCSRRIATHFMKKERSKIIGFPMELARRNGCMVAAC